MSGKSKNYINIGDRFISNQCGWFTVVGIVKHPKGLRLEIEFDEVMGVRHRIVTLRKHVLSGGIRNPYFPLKLGVACVGNVNSKLYKAEFNKWRGMIERCYDPLNNHYEHYGGRGVTVCDSWLCFEYFLMDLPSIDGYNKPMLSELHLDKDIKGDGMLYSPETCILVDGPTNVNEMNRRIKQKTFTLIDLQTGKEFTYDNQALAAKELGIDQGQLSRALNGKSNSAIKQYIIKGICN